MLTQARMIEPADDADFDFTVDFDQDLGGFTISDLLADLVAAHYAVLRANRAMVGMTFADEGYARARQISDAALLQLSQAKWHAGGITHAYNGVVRSNDPQADGAVARDRAHKATAIARDLEAALRNKTPLDAINLPQVQLDYAGTECLRADGVPIVPSICPVVVLRGSSRDMGRQYAQQVIRIYGDFNFAHLAALRFTPERLAILRRWEAQFEAHTPEILDFCRGWAEGASASGCPMSYDHVLHLWTGSEPPAPDFDSGAAPLAPDMRLPVAMYFATGKALQRRQTAPAIDDDHNPFEHCSGICAWGEASADGKLKAASTTDHDCWMQATIVAYPDDGAPFIYTPFSVSGWLPGMASQRFAGHPGMNAHGLAYVHHGGEAHMMEPMESWGYGVTRGAATFHALRYAKSAKEAQEMHFSWPIGDVGAVLGAPGGQWADHDYGCIIESREVSDERPRGLIRTGTPDRDGVTHDILYAGNSSLHPDADGNNHGYAPGELTFDVERGWHTQTPTDVSTVSLKHYALRLTAIGGERPRSFYRHAIPASGGIDTDWMFRLYRTPTPDYPDIEVWDDEIEALQGGRRLRMAPARRCNAFTAVMEPDSDGRGLYHGCIGPLARDLPPGSAAHDYYYYDETNTYWTLRLAESPEDLTADAGARAAGLIAEAGAVIEGLAEDYAGAEQLRDWHRAAKDAYAEGGQLIETMPGGQQASDDAIMDQIALAVRCFTRAQVRARQIVDAVNPPPSLDHH